MGVRDVSVGRRRSRSRLLVRGGGGAGLALVQGEAALMPLPLGDILAGLLRGIAQFLKEWFGLGKPQETQVTEAKPDKPIDDRPDDTLLGELGVESKEKKP